jgi:hypothetical protein
MLISSSLMPTLKNATFNECEISIKYSRLFYTQIFFVKIIFWAHTANFANFE